MPNQIRKHDQKLIDEYIAWLGGVGNRARKTTTSYRHELEYLARVKGPLLGVETRDLADYMHQRGGREATRARRHTVLNGFFGYLVNVQRQRTVNPVDSLPRITVSREQRLRITQIADRLDQLAREDRIAAELILETGMRLGELVSINVRGPIGPQVKVEGRGGKRRLVDLSPRARALLEELGGRLPRSGRTLQKRLREIGLTPETLREISLRTTPITLHPRLERRIRRLIEQQEGEEAVFAAYREVEIRVRELAGAPSERIGVPLMRLAFGSGGPLTDSSLPPGEQQATSDLLAGAIGSFKNPSSHRAVSRPAAHIREALMLANLLMRMLDETEARLGSSQ